jgi:tetratricopeptide (TPR) repeat protein
MKYVYIAIAAIFTIVFCFCSGEKQSVKENFKNTYVSKSLSEANLFIHDSIEAALDSVPELQKAEGRKYFLQALDMLVNKKNAQGSIEFFKESIYYYPNEKSYFFLAKAYMETGDIDNAGKAMDVAAEHAYSPYSEVAYAYAVVDAMRKDTNECVLALSEAVNSGFLDKDRILAEKAFDFMRNDQRYTALIVNTFNDDAKLKALLFKNYLELFPDLNTPYTSPIDSASKYNFDRYINYDYAAFIPGMEDGRFSRDVSNEYLYVGKLKLGGGNHAVIYKTVLAIADTLNPVKTFVMVYDSIGNIKDSEMIGCYCSPTEAIAYTVKEDHSIESTGYHYTWKFDPLEKGYAGNEVTSRDIDKPTSLKLTGSGTIEREEIAKSGPSVAKTGG